MKDRRHFHTPFFQWDSFETVTVFLRSIASYCTKCTEASRKEVFMIPMKNITAASHVLNGAKRFVYILQSEGIYSMFTDLFYDLL